MMKSQKDGCEHLEYAFLNNKKDKTFELSYSFSSGVIEHGGTVVFKPHVRTLRYVRKQRGRNSEIDAVFDDREKMAEITKNAEQRFSSLLGDAIERAIQISAHQALYGAGVKFRGTATQMVQALTQAERKQLSMELGIKRGAPKGKKQPRLLFAKKTLEVELPQKIRQLRRRADRDPTRTEAAHGVGLPNAKALDRLRDRFGDTRPWRQVLAES